MAGEDEALNHFIAGFVSGEGSFYIAVQKNVAYRSRMQMVCGFSIKGRDGDRELIDTIWRALDFAGHVNAIKAKRYPADTFNGNDAILLIIRKLSDLTTRVIPFFDRYPLRGRRRENYELWKQAVALIESRQHLTIEGLDRIMEIKAQMSRY